MGDENENNQHLEQGSPNNDTGGSSEEWAKALAEQKERENVEKAELEALVDEGSDVDGNHNLDVVLDIPVTLSLEVGNAEVSIRNLLKLNQGSVIELDRLAGDPLDLYVNGTLIAHGEVVVVNDKFGVRLTDVVSSAERIKKIASRI